MVKESEQASVNEATTDGKKKIFGMAQAAGKGFAKMANGIGKTTTAVAKKTTESVVKSKEAVFQAIDQNGDGQIGIEDVIIMGLNVPGVKINREAFLRKELFKYYPQDVIDDAVQFNPLHAKIKLEDIDKIANEVIKFERNCVSGISAALGAPGGVAMVATIPADIAQYYGYMIRVVQKLLYLYGFPEIDSKEQGNVIDTETMNTIIICMGVMYGVAGANKAIKVMAKALGTGVEKQLMKKALTKGSIYPIVKKVSNFFSVNLTKKMFSGFFKKSIPVIGGVIGGGITFFSFKPCCDKFKLSLQDTMLSNPNYNSDNCELDITTDDAEIIDVEVVEI
ncbi:EcsC protein family protein [Hathewaya proteolytica DSM 3090]|uniref:EcsC protein family protein n=1 Tax=Hathewaya proteolytica DSM 3090 TaxID=1121331 RepID=A0A1M6N3V6_9CLOT|nr:EcsC family protein [Hathewaya proteolytica]SHJ90375.1 EcsC protein family protein [Hathewaya proteolytica DSM 3090]